MRSDNLKGHMKHHKDLYSLEEEVLHEELRKRKYIYLAEEKRRQKIEAIALEEDVSLKCVEVMRNVDVDALRIDVIRDKRI